MIDQHFAAGARAQRRFKPLGAGQSVEIEAEKQIGTAQAGPGLKRIGRSVDHRRRAVGENELYRSGRGVREYNGGVFAAAERRVQGCSHHAPRSIPVGTCVTNGGNDAGRIDPLA